ncbi:MAG: efflux RND transporter periplasmic adaptor subunit [Planctomycetes bacterium]|nr:efflux RND transporter periplasmic adaptor subunit [Planctomycetota bacterium]
MKTLLRRGLFGLRVLLVRIRFVGLMLAVALGVAYWDTALYALRRLDRPPPASASDVEFFCPMDPQIVRAEPASCPICGMPLSRRAKGAPPELPKGVLARVQLTPYRVALADVGTVEVARRPLEVAIDTVGAVAIDERRLARIASRVRGRVDRLFVDFTGVEVREGEPLVWLYSQELYTTARELLAARTAGGPVLEAARRRLLLWGLRPAQVERILARGEPETHVEVLSPISGTVVSKSVVAGDYVDEGTQMYTVADLSVLWMVARVYEDEAPLVHLGQPVEIRASAYPERTFEGHVSFVDPTIDPATRTVGVRVDVPNGHGLLRPGMSVRARLHAPVGPDGVPVRGQVEVVYRCCSACPDVLSREPGTCPRCAMPLTPVEERAPLGPGGAWECRCPMHPDHVVRSDRPGPCPECGAPLARENAPPPPRPAPVTVYECSGHPEATRDTPGICLPCGTMELIPRETTADEARALLAQARPEASAPLTGEGDVTLYECPGHPEATRDTPGICLPCGTMELLPRTVTAEEARERLSRARPEASRALAAPARDPALAHAPLAVPADAVIDTGGRRVAYVEVAPGIYDAVEVVVGPRVGPWLPVVRGLREGQRVVARGAFLVDAEARLNPAAASIYFGASSGGR